MSQFEIIIQALESVRFGLLLFRNDGSVAYVNPWIRDYAGLGETLDATDNGKGPYGKVIELVRGFLKRGLETSQARLVINNRTIFIEVSRSNDGGAVCCVMPDTKTDQSYESFYQSLQSQELNAIFKLSSDGILLCDNQGCLVKINEASERLNGWTAKEVVGRNVEDLIREKMIDKSVTLEVLQTQETVNMMQYIGRTKKHLLVTGTPLFGRDGRIKLVVVNERDLTQLNATQRKLEESQAVSEKYREKLAEIAALNAGDRMVKGESPVMGQVLQYAVKLARLEASNILITGESGVGKGLMAKFIHQNSPRQGKPLIQINCAAVPEGLLEAELFGYERGAFTGAGLQGKAGLFELAHTGTLFLDEIGDCPLSIQAKLLKYLDDHEVQRLGGVRSRIIDCTIIAATNRDLQPLIKARQFRADLYYRLNTFTIHIPPLRERPEDTFELIMYFLDLFNNRYGCKSKISSKALHLLQHHSFPGNVRELKNILKQAVVISESDVLDEFILSELEAPKEEKPPAARAGWDGLSLKEQLDRYERELLTQALSSANTTRGLARFLGVSQATVVRRLKKHKLPLPDLHK